MATTTLHPNGVTGVPYSFIAKTENVASAVNVFVVMASEAFVPGPVLSDAYEAGATEAEGR